MVVDIGGVRQGVSDCHNSTNCLYIAVRYLLRFCLKFEVDFWFSQFGKREPLGPWGWAFVVSDGASVTSHRSHYKAIRCLLWYCRRV